MNKIRKLFNQIRFKIFVLNCLILMIAIFTLGYVLYNFTSTYLINREHQRIDLLAQTTEQQIDNLAQNYQLYMFDLVNSIENSDFSKETIIKKLKNSYSPYIYKSDNRFSYISSELEIYSANEQIRLDELVIKEMYDNVASSKSHFLSMGAFLSPERGMLLVFATKCLNTQNEIEGVLICDIALHSISDYITNYNYDNNISLVVLNESLRPIITDINIDIKDYLEIKSNIINSLKENSTNTLPIMISNNQKYYVSLYSPSYIDWHLAFIINENHLLKPLDSIKTYVYVFAFVFFLLIALISLFVAQYIDHPLKSIISQMNKIREGNLKAHVILNSNDEFSILAESYNNMLDRINKLIEENTKSLTLKNEYELKALQAQINPHFLYNTLNTVNSLVDLNRADEIPILIKSLVNLLCHTLDKVDALIPIGEELLALENYMSIYFIRFDNKINIEYEVNPDILDYKIIKLTMQPLVENSIFHGFSKPSENKTIKITGDISKNNDSIVFYIEDNGIGITKDKLSKLLKTQEKPIRNHFNSIGLSNVNERIKLYFGKEYGLDISSKVGKGTKIKIVIPIIK